MGKFKSKWAEIGKEFGLEEVRATAVILGELEKLGDDRRRERVLRNVQSIAYEAQRMVAEKDNSAILPEPTLPFTDGVLGSSEVRQ